jgi:hypothetical protein
MGLFLFLLGVVIAYLAVYSPLKGATDGAPEVSVSMKGAFIVPLLVGYGLVFTLLGPRAGALFGGWRPGEKPTLLGWALLLLLLGAGVGLYFWLVAALRGYGYVVG